MIYSHLEQDSDSGDGFSAGRNRRGAKWERSKKEVGKKSAPNSRGLIYIIGLTSLEVQSDVT